MMLQSYKDRVFTVGEEDECVRIDPIATMHHGQEVRRQRTRRCCKSTRKHLLDVAVDLERTSFQLGGKDACLTNANFRFTF